MTRVACLEARIDEGFSYSLLGFAIDTELGAKPLTDGSRMGF